MLVSFLFEKGRHNIDNHHKDNLFRGKGADGYVLEVVYWNDLIKLGSAEGLTLPKDDGQADDTAVILYSGGTSGAPKGIMLSNLNFNALAYQAYNMVEPAGHGKSLLAILPIFHGFGLGVCIHTPLCCGMKAILVPDFSPKKFIALIKKNKPNVICAVPSLYEMFTKNPNLGKKDLECLEDMLKIAFSDALKKLILNQKRIMPLQYYHIWVYYY